MKGTARPRQALVVGLGLLAAAVAAVAKGIPARDALELIALSFGSALLAYLLGRRAASVVRRRLGVTGATAVVAAIPVVALGVGTLVAARLMFVSAHDLTALLVVIIGAGTAGALGALALGAELAAARHDAEEARERERMVEKSRRELVAWVSHDLRTPLAGVRAMVEALQDGVVDDAETTQRYHDQMGVEVERLSRLVDDLFELATIQADAVQLTLDRVSLSDLAADAVAAVAAGGANAKGVVVAERVTGDTQVTASARELTRVVHNLLDNAIRHTPPGGHVYVDVDIVDGTGVVSVSDGCGGIPDGQIERVFDLAYRGDDARSPGGGAGLGLAIARGLVEAHDGDIGVSNDNGGCRFTVRLPSA